MRRGDNAAKPVALRDRRKPFLAHAQCIMRDAPHSHTLLLRLHGLVVGRSNRVFTRGENDHLRIEEI